VADSTNAVFGHVDAVLVTANTQKQQVCSPVNAPLLSTLPVL